MKKKYLFLCAGLLISMVSSLGLVSCGDDDDDDDYRQDSIAKQDSSNVLEDSTSKQDSTQDSISVLPTSDDTVPVMVSGQVDGYDYVDLGLSVKWATYNFGASAITELGGRYSFGDNSVSKVWSSSWNTPTGGEMRELINGCDWEWTDDFEGSGVAGQIGTSHKNGNRIFLPATGEIDVTDGLTGIGSYGNYWTSSGVAGASHQMALCYACFKADCSPYTSATYNSNGSGQFTSVAYCFSVRPVTK